VFGAVEVDDHAVHQVVALVVQGLPELPSAQGVLGVGVRR
jgi:hypothetical protein